MVKASYYANLSTLQLFSFFFYLQPNFLFILSIIFPFCVFIYVSFISCIPALSLLFYRSFVIRFSLPSFTFVLRLQLHLCLHFNVNTLYPSALSVCTNQPITPKLLRNTRSVFNNPKLCESMYICYRLIRQGHFAVNAISSGCECNYNFYECKRMIRLS